MLRTLLVGILAVTAAAACSGKSDAPAAQPGVAAGKVVEVTGKVTATRGTEVRTLAQGGEISSDDVIDTAAESRVVILVAHNNARWDLGPNKHGKVGDSLAWTAAKADRPAGAVTEETSTAGRHAEKNAATTDTTTARADSEPDMQTKGSEPTPASTAPVAPVPAVEPTAPPPPIGAPTAASSATEAVQPMRDEAELNREKDIASAPKTAPKTAPSKKPGKAIGNESFELGLSGTGPGGGTGDGVGVGAPRNIQETPERALQLEIRKTFARQRTAMRACLEAPTERLLVSLTVTKGAYSIATTDPAATDSARACLAKIVKKLPATVSKVDKPVTVQFVVSK